MSSAEPTRFDAVPAAEQIHQQQALDLPLPGEQTATASGT
jgi:hypothetical protein